MNRLHQYRLDMVVFFGGAIGMILEIVGSRVVSPYFGNSLVVWTNLIGVVLGSLSAGYYFGGKSADKRATYEKLETIIFVGALFLCLTAFLKEVILGMVHFQMGGDIKSASFLAILILFGPVSFMLGMIAPMAAKLRLQNLSGTGSVVGTLYALSTFGSIVGTFLAGFILIPSFGNSNLLYGLAMGLTMVATMAAWRVQVRHLFLIFFIGALFFLNNRMGIFRMDTLADVDSLYNRIIVRQYEDQDRGKVNMMSIDNAGIQSAVMLDKPDELYLDYTKDFVRLDLSQAQLSRVLVIGGGGYAIPRYILDRNDKSVVEVVEIDSEITRLAERYFFLESNPRLKIIHEDARSFIQDIDEEYDTIILDAFNSLTPPPHLTTKEFMKDLYRHLDQDGILVINMVTALAGPRSRFLLAELTTLNNIFADVRLFSSGVVPADDIQNAYVLAYKNDKSTNIGVRARGSEVSKELTDDWAPVEYLTKDYY